MAETEDEIHREVLLNLYEDIKKEEEVVLNTLRRVRCHCCGRTLKGEFIAFHDPHEAIRYVRLICWKECKKQ